MLIFNWQRKPRVRWFYVVFVDRKDGKINNTCVAFNAKKLPRKFLPIAHFVATNETATVIYMEEMNEKAFRYFESLPDYKIIPIPKK